MNYSVYDSPNKLVDYIASDGNGIYKELKDAPFPKYAKRSMQSNFDDITTGNIFYGMNGTKGVVKEFYGSHVFDAKSMSSLVCEISNMDFHKDSFKFIDRQTSGMGVNVGRYLSGDQRCWYSMRKQRKPNLAIRVFAPFGGLGNVSQNQMKVCGALSCAITDMLETIGINVELWASCVINSVLQSHDDKAYDFIYENSSHLCTLIKLKDSEQYCDYGIINYVTGNSHFYRNIVFKDRLLYGLKLHLSTGMKVLSHDIGDSSYNFEQHMIPDDPDHDKALDIVVPRIYDIDQAKHWLENDFMKKLKLLNGVLEQ